MTDGNIVFETLRPTSRNDSLRSLLDEASHGGDNIDEHLPSCCVRWSLCVPAAIERCAPCDNWREELAARHDASANAASHGWFAQLEGLSDLPVFWAPLFHESIWPDPMADRVLWPHSAHSATLILLHGFTCDGGGYLRIPECFYRDGEPFPGLKVVLPTAPLRPITAYSGEMYRSWYDYLTDHEGHAEDELDQCVLAESTARIHEMLDVEVAHLGTAKRVFLGGSSQGCAVAFDAALSYSSVLGGVFAAQGHLLSNTVVPACFPPVRVFHGLADTTMPWTAWVSPTYDRLRMGDYKEHLEDGVDHADDDAEKRWIQSFLSEMLENEVA
eukprot:CAMPEP_0194527604 /NCGR_PEP_ID=MMETSP0253-20130528/63748_1 /TAXON_ID=2966 /ORGANISM="Noctiluca scintillans" /LENGTH=328 /DNA_ID=CAMNT_0039372565 /DNA_START=42 /DNA_END=1028 /DNA_ORIENTATION=-